MITTWRARAATPEGRTAVRYALVSVISVVVGQLTVIAVFYFGHWSAQPANVAGVVAGGIPSYYLNRRWSWGKTGRHSLGKEVAPFWVMTFVGLVLSTWFAGFAGRFGEDNFDSRALQTLCVMAASFLAFGTLWVAKFLAFNRFMFGPRS